MPSSGAIERAGRFDTLCRPFDRLRDRHAAGLTADDGLGTSLLLSEQPAAHHGSLPVRPAAPSTRGPPTRYDPWFWIPACAGMTVSGDRRAACPLSSATMGRQECLLLNEQPAAH
ncbi:MAG TPA: hypothetical protein PLM57_12950, partial [Candidatus Latescibacteria bacterium]|nr:hypothetical protein [Candidatus Latescibacterota bacterium]